ncbi:DUF3098 domain-containing protein [Duncaniella muris]|uniref:DUF3098 domain-containing protein n=1 Tax=Duncaniella muris TaxID=2094150 RepID=UPI002674BA0B|nr:DUF3098 domain-containing protein [Duncaniella muris]
MAYKQTTKPSAPQGSQLDPESRSQLPFLKMNFILMAIAGVMIVLGFCLMAGGATDWDAFNADIFSVRRVVVGPTIAFLGFIFMGFAIMYSPKGKV